MKPKFKKRNLNQINSLTEGLVRHEVNEHQVERDYPLSRFKSDMGSSIKQYESGTYAHRRGAGKETPSERAARMTQLENEEMAKAEREHEAYKKSQAAKSSSPTPSYRPSNTSTQQRSSQIDTENEKAYKEWKAKQTSSQGSGAPKTAPPPLVQKSAPATKPVSSEPTKTQRTPVGKYESDRQGIREKPATFNKSGSGRHSTYRSASPPATADDYRWNDRGAPGQAQQKADIVNSQRNMQEFKKTPEYIAMQKAQEKNANDPHYQRNRLKAKRLGMSTDELADKKGTFRSAYMNKKAEEASKQRDQRSTKETVKQFMSREVPRDYKRERTKSNQPRR